MGTPAAEQKKSLEQLMGRDSQSGLYRKSHYKSYQRDLGLYDPRICKSYLVGECPYDLFQGTKLSMGRCPQVHSAKYRLLYEKEKKKGKKFPDFEREYQAVLSRFVSDCNGQISIALDKLEHTPEETERIKQVTGELDVLDSRIGLMVEEIESLLRADEVSQAMIQGTKLQAAQEKRQEVAKRVKSITENVGQSAQQKLQVCEVCGAYLSRLDTDRRLADHFLGKVHLGYVKMREELDRMKQLR